MLCGIMRTIKFRGKLCHSNQWVYGNLIIANNGEPYIIPQEVFDLYDAYAHNKI